MSMDVEVVVTVADSEWDLFALGHDIADTLRDEEAFPTIESVTVTLPAGATPVGFRIGGDDGSVRVARAGREHDATRVIVTLTDGQTRSYTTCDLDGGDTSLWEDPAPFVLHATRVEFRRIRCEHAD